MPTSYQSTYCPRGQWSQLTQQCDAASGLSFWLKGEEDPDPAKADQYPRWRELAKLQEASKAGRKPN
jgi:hypothetical protein